MVKIYEALNWASSFLTEHGRETKVGEWLLMHELAISRTQLLVDYHESVTEEAFHLFQEKIVRHATTGVPVQHIIGSESFYERTFQVNPNVLIPRPETEELIQAILSQISISFADNQPLAIADIGTGSGIIATTMQLELGKRATVHASDISESALLVAKENARNLGADAIQFHQGHLLNPLIEKSIRVEVLLSNPPYIPLSDKATLTDVVVDHDPALALFGGEDGLAIYRELMPKLPLILAEHALIGFEIGHNQGAAVSELLQAIYPEAKVSVLLDIHQKERIVLAKI